MSIEVDGLLNDFIFEAEENLERMDRELVILEADSENAELLASIFRTIHTIKGSAGFLKLERLEYISHHTEDVLSRLRERSLSLTGDLITLLLSAMDCIKSILRHLKKDGKEGNPDMSVLVAQLQEVQEKGTIHIPFIKVVSEIDEPGTPVVNDAEAFSYPPAPEDRIALSKKLLDKGEQGAGMTEEARAHIDVKLLDQLMNLTGELVLTRNQVVQLVGKMNESNFRDVLHRMTEVSQRMNTVVSELQETVMKTRMQPIQRVLGTLPRLVRDVSKSHGKNVQFRTEGQFTELDRTLIEGIKDPITHLVRNAIDHGIESSKIRKQHGKSPMGTIVIKTYHEGGQVHIDISDDGAGFDLQRIKAKALKEGILTAQQIETASEQFLLNLVFRPGFSTASKITEISGRGVGMDVVKKNLDKIGGVVDIHTVPHRGATVKMRIPITLAIIPALIITSSQHRFAIPQVNLEELLMPDASGDQSGKWIQTVSGAEVYRLRGELLPLIRLNTILGIASNSKGASKGVNVVVLSSENQRFGLIVDQVNDTEEIVVKPLSRHVKQVSYYEGATIMGDGKVALILNVDGLCAASKLNRETMTQIKQRAQEEQDAMTGVSAEQRQTIVLFRVGANEYYGVPLAFVVRLEEFLPSQIEYSGGREVLQYRGEILPLLRLEPYMNIPTIPDPMKLSLLVFSIERQIGLVVTEVINTIEIGTQIDTETFNQKGVLGSTIVEGHSVLILDIHGLIQLAYPTWYKKFFVSKLSESERQNVRILLVEDSLFFQNIEKSYLEAAGYQVIVANHGQEAVEKLENQMVDVVVTDIDMPYCNGYELTKILRAKEEWKHLPVMALTALSGEEDRQKGMDVGIDEYQIKLDRDDVVKTLEQLVLRARKQPVH